MTKRPITLSDFGSFHVGGRVVTVTDAPKVTLNISEAIQNYSYDPNGDFAIEAAYVEFAVPQAATGPAVLLLHGGGMCGTVWNTTPDGRPGWRNLLLERGHPVYVIDMVERGRAGFCAIPNTWDGAPIMRSLQDGWETFRIGPAPEGGRYTAFEGQRFPHAHFERSAYSWAPRWLGNDAISLKALITAIDRIGAVHVVAHSTGCLAALKASEVSENLVGLTLLEPAGAAPTTPLRLEKITSIWGDFLDESPFWTNLRRQSDQVLDRSDVAFTSLDLTSFGLAGHSHNLMQDFGNEAVLDIARETFA